MASVAVSTPSGEYGHVGAEAQAAAVEHQRHLKLTQRVQSLRLLRQR